MDAQCEIQTQQAVPNTNANQSMQEQSRYSAFKQVCQSLQSQAIQYQSQADAANTACQGLCESAYSLLNMFRAQVLTLASNVNGIYNSLSAVQLANQAVQAGSGDLFTCWATYADQYQTIQNNIDAQYLIIDNMASMINTINTQFQAAISQYQSFYNTAQTNIPSPQNLVSQIQAGSAIAQAAPTNQTIATASTQNDLSNSANAQVTSAVVASQPSPASNTVSPVVAAVVVSDVVPAVATASASAPAAAPASASTVAPVDPSAVVANQVAVPTGAIDINSIVNIPVVANAQKNLIYWGIGLIGLLWLLK